MKGVIIKPMTDADLEEVARVFMNTFNNLGENWTMETSFEHVKQNFFGDSHFLAISENRIVAFLMAITLIREKGPELFVDSIAVLPEYQERGVGKKLWEKAVTYTKDKKLKGIRLLANPSLRSYDWYKSMDLTETGWIELFKEI